MVTSGDDDEGGGDSVAVPQDDLPEPELDGDIFGDAGGGSGETGGGSGSDFCARLGTLTGSFGLDVADALSADVLYEFDPAYLEGYRQLPRPEEIAEEFAVSAVFVEQVISGTAYPLSDVSEPTDVVRAYIDDNC
jgi:hypothetical protein